MPIHNIKISHDTVYLMSYGSDRQQVHVKVSGNKTEILDFYSHINLVYNKKSYADTKAFLRQEKENLILELIGKESTESIKFIKSADDIAFGTPEDLFFRYAFRGNYSLNGNRFLINSDGKINNSNLWNEYVLLRHGYHSRDNSGNFYNLVSFKKGGVETSYAVKVKKDRIILYTYTSETPLDFNIRVSDSPVFILERVDN